MEGPTRYFFYANHTYLMQAYGIIPVREEGQWTFENGTLCYGVSARMNCIKIYFPPSHKRWRFVGFEHPHSGSYIFAK